MIFQYSHAGIFPKQILQCIVLRILGDDFTSGITLELLVIGCLVGLIFGPARLWEVSVC